jgi:hypothetical protein
MHPFPLSHVHNALLKRNAMQPLHTHPNAHISAAWSPDATKHNIDATHLGGTLLLLLLLLGGCCLARLPGLVRHTLTLCTLRLGRILLCLRSEVRDGRKGPRA